MRLEDQLLVVLVDKGALAVLILGAGYLVNRGLETFKSELARRDRAEASRLALANELAKLKSDTHLKFLERQLSQFYWPVLLRLQKDSSVWRRVPALSNGDNVFPKEIGERIEKFVILPNHEETVRIIESNIHLVQDEKVVTLLEKFIRHVAVYSALRSSGSELNPIDLGEPYPDELSPLLAKKTRELQDRYNTLLQFEQPMRELGETDMRSQTDRAATSAN
jgi:hypothetical protein